MAKALLGMHTTPRAHELLHEVRALKGRIAELEGELDDARTQIASAARAAAERATTKDLAEVVLTEPAPQEASV